MPTSSSRPQRLERDNLLSVDRHASFSGSTARAFHSTIPRWYIDQSRSGRLSEPQLRAAREAAGRLISAMRAPFRGSPRTSAPICKRLCRRSYVERGIAGFGGYARVLSQRRAEDLRRGERCASGSSSSPQANEAAAKAMDELKTWLESRAQERHGEFRSGPWRFSQEMLKQTERVRHAAR